MYIYNLIGLFSIILSDECVSTKLGVTENFVSSLYLLIQSATLKKCIEHCLTALATLLHVFIYLFIFSLRPGRQEKIKVLTFCLIDNSTCWQVMREGITDLFQRKWSQILKAKDDWDHFCISKDRRPILYLTCLKLGYSYISVRWLSLHYISMLVSQISQSCASLLA